MRSSPLQTRLVAALLLLLAAAAVLTALGTAVALHRVLIDRIDQELAAEARELLADLPPPGAQIEPAGVAAQIGARQITGTVNAIVQGTEVVAAWQVRTAASFVPIPPTEYRDLASLAVGTPPRTVDLGPLGPHRMIVVITPYGDRLAMGLPEGPARATLTSLIAIELAVAGAALVGVGLVAMTAVRRTLRPLADMTVTATQVSMLPLSQGEVSLVERVPDLDIDTGTEVDQVAAALNRMLDHVESALRARQDSEEQLRNFLADASHELRTPLTAIRGYAELSSRHHGMSAEAAHSMSRITHQAERMTGLVEDLLLLARLDAGRPLERRGVDLTRLVVDAVDDAYVSGPDHRWQLDLPSEPLTTTGDEARLAQVLANLLANARQHTPPGTAVTVSLAGDGAGAWLSVVDDGPGIAPDLLPTLFQRFVRGSGPATRLDGSSGLGLAIVAAIVAAHDGRVEVTSAPGRTEFSVHLPHAGLVRPAHPDRERATRRHRPLRPVRRRPASSPQTWRTRRQQAPR